MPGSSGGPLGFLSSRTEHSSSMLEELRMSNACLAQGRAITTYIGMCLGCQASFGAERFRPGLIPIPIFLYSLGWDHAWLLEKICIFISKLFAFEMSISVRYHCFCYCLTGENLMSRRIIATSSIGCTAGSFILAAVRSSLVPISLTSLSSGVAQSDVTQFWCRSA